MEAQQAEASESSRQSKRPLSPEQQARQRQTDELQLARTRVVHQLESASNPRHRQMLEESLKELERRIENLRSLEP